MKYLIYVAIILLFVGFFGDLLGAVFILPFILVIEFRNKINNWLLAFIVFLPGISNTAWKAMTGEENSAVETLMVFASFGAVVALIAKYLQKRKVGKYLG